MENGSNGGDEEKEVGVSHHGVKEKRDTSSWMLVEVCGGGAHGGNNVAHGTEALFTGQWCSQGR